MILLDVGENSRNEIIHSASLHLEVSSSYSMWLSRKISTNQFSVGIF